MPALRASLGSKIALILVAIVTLASVAPLFSVIVSSMIASALAVLTRRRVGHPCMLAGADIGGALYTGFVMGWLMLLTAPIVLATALFWIVVGVRAVMRRRTGRAAG